MVASEITNASHTTNTTTSHTTNTTVHHTQSRQGEFLILLLIAGLFAALACRWLSKRTKIPETISFMVLGTIVGATHVQWHENYRLLLVSFEKINPHTILFLFLPPLLQESTTTIEYQTFKRLLFKILLLAFPGVLLSTYLFGFTMKYLLFADWPLKHGLLLGSILSATDPVAVVATLKALGVDKSIGHLIEGESLFNDGSAMVIFQLIIKAIKGPLEIPYVIGYFLQLSLGGPLLGVVAFVVVYNLLHRVHSAPLEINIILVSCYGIWWIAELSGLGVSGVLAVVVFGVVLKGYGISALTDRESHEHFWHIFGSWANDLIFLLSGIFTGQFIYKEMFPTATHLSITEKFTEPLCLTTEPVANTLELIRIPLLYIFATIWRLITVFVFHPLMKLGNKSVLDENKKQNWKIGLIATWSGLRGAVGLCLGIQVMEQPSICLPIKERILWYVLWIVILTSCINGTTISFLLKWLKIIKFESSRAEFLEHIVQDTYQNFQNKKNDVSLINKTCESKQQKEYNINHEQILEKTNIVNILELLYPMERIKRQCKCFKKSKAKEEPLQLNIEEEGVKRKRRDSTFNMEIQRIKENKKYSESFDKQNMTPEIRYRQLNALMLTFFQFHDEGLLNCTTLRTVVQIVEFMQDFKTVPFQKQDKNHEELIGPVNLKIRKDNIEGNDDQGYIKHQMKNKIIEEFLQLLKYRSSYFIMKLVSIFCRCKQQKQQKEQYNDQWDLFNTFQMGVAKAMNRFQKGISNKQHDLFTTLQEEIDGLIDTISKLIFIQGNKECFKFNKETNIVRANKHLDATGEILSKLILHFENTYAKSGLLEQGEFEMIKESILHKINCLEDTDIDDTINVMKEYDDKEYEFEYHITESKINLVDKLCQNQFLNIPESNVN